MNQQNDDDWPKRLAAAIGSRVRERRSSLGLSAQQLAERTRLLGYEVKRSVIAEMENGKRRTIPLPDVLVLARALGLPPLALVMPGRSHQRAEMLPRTELEFWSAIDWITGLRPLEEVAPWVESIEEDRTQVEQWRNAAAGLQLRNEAKRLAAARQGHRLHADAYSRKADATEGREAARLESLALRETELAERCQEELAKVAAELEALGMADASVTPHE